MPFIKIQIDTSDLKPLLNSHWLSWRAWAYSLRAAAVGGALSAVGAALDDPHLRAGLDPLITAKIAAVGAAVQAISFMVKSPLQPGGSWLSCAIAAALGGMASGLAPTLTDVHIWQEAVHTGEWTPIISMAKTGVMIAMLGLLTKSPSQQLPAPSSVTEAVK